jgi:FixJ family two-component response regulator
MRPREATPVVVVNSDPQKLAELTQLLQARGHTVMAFERAEDALEAIAPPPQTVLLIDKELADMSGVDLMHRVQERGVYQPTIVTVPSNAVGDAVQALRYGAMDILESPLSENNLLQSIKQAAASKPGSES